MSPVRAFVVATCACGAIASGWVKAASQTRDLTAVPPTAAIAGTVTAEDTVGAPLRRVRVTLKGPDPVTEQTFVTGDDGAFRFHDLAAGRYTLVAAKEAYLTTEYRARQPGRSGLPIVLTSGAQITGVSIPLLRGSVIAGRVLGLDGHPIPNRVVSVVAARVVKGTRTLTLVEAPGANTDYIRRAITDDEGNYRIYDLAPGEYLVVVGMLGFAQWTNIWHMTTAEDLQRAKSSARQPRPPAAAAGTSSLSFPLPIAQGIPGLSPGAASNPLQFAPVYYPGTPVASEATRVTLGRSEERDGIDLQLILARTASVGGTVVEPTGRAGANVAVQILSSEPQVSGAQGSSTVTPLADGKFFRAGLAPGRYTIEARTLPNGVAGSTRDQPAWAQTEVAVAGLDLTGVTLTLQPTATVGGRVVVPAGADPNVPIQITLTPDVAIEGSWVAPRTVNARNGKFEIADVLPGRYRLSAALPSAAASISTGLFFAGAAVSGRDATDTPFELTSGQVVDDAAVSFTDRPSRLSGMLLDVASQPALDYFIVALPTEPSWWFWQSRRIRVQHASSDGSFAIAGLPAGEYALAVVTDLDADDAFDPALLQQLLAQSVHVTIAEGASTVQNLRIAK